MTPLQPGACCSAKRPSRPAAVSAESAEPPTAQARAAKAAAISPRWTARSAWLYGRDEEQRGRHQHERGAGLGPSALTVPEWINQVHTLFPKETIERLERDAVERYRIDEIVTSPKVLERLRPNPTLLKAVLWSKHLDEPRRAGARACAGRRGRAATDRGARDAADAGACRRAQSPPPHAGRELAQLRRGRDVARESSSTTIRRRGGWCCGACCSIRAARARSSAGSSCCWSTRAGMLGSVIHTGRHRRVPVSLARHPHASRRVRHERRRPDRRDRRPGRNADGACSSAAAAPTSRARCSTRPSWIETAGAARSSCW